MGKSKLESKGGDVSDLNARIGELRQSSQDIVDMRVDKTTEYRYEQWNSSRNLELNLPGPITRKSLMGDNDRGDKVITMFTDTNIENQIHETRHGGQLARNEYSLNSVNIPSSNFGAQDEISAYRAEYSYNGALKYMPAIDTNDKQALILLGTPGGIESFRKTINNINQITNDVLREMVDNAIKQSYIYRNYGENFWKN